MSEAIIKHLDLTQEYINLYSTDSENECLTSNMWVLIPFQDDGTDDYDTL